MALYHKDIGFPTWVKDVEVRGKLKFSRHAREAAVNDKHGSIRNLPTEVDHKVAELIEVETAGREVVKVVYRQPLDAHRDISFAIIPRERFVKTIWLNMRNDKHKTLRRDRYDDPRANRKSGFTLTETLAALALVSALGAFALQQLPILRDSVQKIADIQCAQQTIVANMIIEDDKPADEQVVRDEWMTACFPEGLPTTIDESLQGYQDLIHEAIESLNND